MDYAPIEAKMKLYREGLTDLPQEYIDYHRELAEEGVKDLRARGYTIHRQWLDLDGWCDGMKTTFLIIEAPSGHLLKLSWHDSITKGRWFEHHQGCGGSSIHDLQGNAP